MNPVPQIKIVKRPAGCFVVDGCNEEGPMSFSKAMGVRRDMLLNEDRHLEANVSNITESA